MKMDPYTRNKLISSGNFDKEKQFWEHQLSGDVPKSFFPEQYDSRYEEDCTDGVTYSFPSELSHQIKKLCNNSELGIFTVIYSALLYIMHKYSGHPDILAVSPIINKSNMNDGVIIKQNINDSLSYKEYLLLVKDTIRQSYQHENYPLCFFDESSINTLVLLENLHQRFSAEDINFNILFSFCIDQDSIKGSIRYKTCLYKKHFIKKIAGHITNFMEKSILAPDTLLRDIPIMTEAERTSITVGFNDTEADYPSDATIHQLFENQVRRTPDAVAVAFGEQELTYGQLNARSNRIARVLREKGVQPDEIVGISMHRSLEMIVGIMAILKAGGAYVPLDPSYPQERIRYMLQDSGARIVLTAGSLTGEIPFEGNLLDVETEQWSGDDSVASKRTDSNAAPVLCEEDTDLEPISGSHHLAYVIYTSGSTGVPKGVPIEHHSVVNRLNWMQKAYPLTTEDVILQKTSFSFDVSVWELFWGTLQGAKTYYLAPGEEKDPSCIANAIERQRVTTLHFVPSMLRAFLEHLQAKGGTIGLQSVRHVFASGEALPAQWAEVFNRLLYRPYGAKLINLYGPTEATVDVTCFDCSTGEALERVPIGKPIDNTRMYIVDANGQLQPVGVAGELCISGAGLSRGYLNRPELNEKTFVSNPFAAGERMYEKMYRTGDLARWLPDGNIEYLGRMDHQVKVRGYRIELGEIESVLLDHESVAAAAVMAREDEEGGKYLCAYLVSTPEAGEDIAGEVRAYLSSRLPEHMVPSSVMQLREMPIGPNGKLDRKALPEPDKHGTGAPAYVAPRNETEAKLAEIWETVLGVEQVGIDAQYFHLGGDSIKGIRLVDAMNQAFGLHMHMIDLYKHPDLRSLAEHIGRLESGVSGQAWMEAQESIERLKQQLLQEEVFSETEIEDIYPMSDIQQGMVYYSMAHPDDAVYHDQFIYQIREPHFEPQLLDRALELMVQKHPMLRCSFHLDQAPGWVQAVHKKVELPVEHFHLQTRSREEQEQFIREELKADRRHPFPLDRAPLWRIKVCMLSADQLALCFIFHHAILDGWSVASFITELMNVYVQLKEDQSFVPEPLANSYRAYIVDQTALKQEEDVLAYWKTELDGYKRLQLPEAVSPEASSGQSERTHIHHPVSQELFEGLKEAARQNGTSVKTVCFAAYVSMLRMISYESDIVVGLVENNRPICEDGDRMLGCFLNTVPFRMPAMEEGATWETVIQSVNRKLQDLKKYGRLPLFEIVKAIGENPSGQNPIFDAMFNFIDFHVYDQADQMEQYAPEQEQLLEVGGYENTNTLFDFNISTTFDRMTVLLNYQSYALPEEWAERLVGYYFSILHEIVEHPAARIDKGELLAPEERDRLLNVFNATYSVYPREKTIHELFVEQAERTPERTAIVFGDQRMTYRELNERTNQMARELKRQGVQPDDIVAVIAERSLEMIVGIFSILKAGGAYLPIDPDFPEERVRYMLEDSGASLLLVQPQLKERASKEESGLSLQLADAVTFSGKVMDLTLDTLEENDEEADNPSHFAAESHQLAYVIYTSGSTGKPKGVMVEHHSLVNRLKWMQKRYPLSGTDVILQKTPFTFDVSVWELFWWALEGAQLCLLEPGGEKDPGMIATAIRKHQVTTMHFVPSMMHAFLEYMEMHRETASLSSLKQVFASGEALHVSHVQRFHQLLGQTNGTHLANLYGPTEATIDVTYFDCTPEANWTSVPIGRPIDNTRMYVLDEQMRLQPLGVPGELFIAGAGLARGYLNKPELTDERFVADPFSSGGLMYRTGDLGRWLPDGNIEYLGRIDHQVKIRGYRIELGEIETQLLRHEQIIETVVMAQQHETAENASLCAYVVSKTELDPSELRRFLTNQLPSYMIPSHFVYLKKLPITPNGKIDRKALPMPDALQTRDEYVPPRNETEEYLAQVWEAVLGIDRVGILDNFFARGGDSIKAIQIASRLQVYQLKMEVRDLFQNPTISELSKYIKKQATVIDQGPVEGEIKLTPIQKWFFGQQFTDMHHFNQSVILHNESHFGEERIRNVLLAVVEHHDILRAYFMEDNYRQFVYRADAPEILEFRVIDMTNEEAALDRIREEAGLIQSNMDLNRGPLLKSALFRTRRGDYLLLVIHHLAVDGISWRILLDDLRLAYNQIENQEPIVLSAKTHSFQEWSERLHVYAGSKTLLQEIPYWSRVEQMEIAELPEDYAIAEDVVKDNMELTFSISKEETEHLLKDVHRAYHTEMNDILLTGLGLALKDWIGQNHVLCNLEGHGRESFDEQLDVTRTMGWFTSMYPVVLDMARADDLSYLIKFTKETLRAIPQKGIGYGILKYITPEKYKPDIHFQLKPQVCFNYLGQFDQDIQSDSFTVISGELSGSSISSKMERLHNLDIVAMVVSGQLHIRFGYNRLMYRQQTVANLAEQYKRHLIRIMEHCLNKKERESTPTDLGYGKLSIDQFDKLKSSLASKLKIKS